MIYALLGGSFLSDAQGHFDPVSYFFGAGIATNIGAAAVGLALGYLWGRAKLKALHAKLDEHGARHDAHAAKLDRIEAALSGDSRAHGPHHPRGPAGA